nr:MAG TPA: hypothetical protein [Caudoviricetes sp.]
MFDFFSLSGIFPHRSGEAFINTTNSDVIAPAKLKVFPSF